MRNHEQVEILLGFIEQHGADQRGTLNIIEEHPCSLYRHVGAGLLSRTSTITRDTGQIWGTGTSTADSGTRASTICSLSSICGTSRLHNLLVDPLHAFLWDQNSSRQHSLPPFVEEATPQFACRSAAARVLVGPTSHLQRCVSKAGSTGTLKLSSSGSCCTGSCGTELINSTVSSKS